MLDSGQMRGKFLGSLLGAAIGDAIGAPWEGGRMVAEHEIELVASTSYLKDYLKWKS